MKTPEYILVSLALLGSILMTSKCTKDKCKAVTVIEHTSDTLTVTNLDTVYILTPLTKTETKIKEIPLPILVSDTATYIYSETFYHDDSSIAVIDLIRVKENRIIEHLQTVNLSDEDTLTVIYRDSITTIRDTIYQDTDTPKLRSNNYYIGSSILSTDEVLLAPNIGIKFRRNMFSLGVLTDLQSVRGFIFDYKFQLNK